MDRYECDRMLVAVLEMGGFAAAAKRLGVSPAKASKLVSRLEGELGVQLIKRSTRALSPTEAGQVYLERIRPLLEGWAELDASVRAVTTEPSGRLRLSVPVSFGVAQLSAVLNAFAIRHPRIQLDVEFSDRQASLVHEGFDAAVRIGRLDDSNLVARRLTTARNVMVAAPAYLARNAPPAQAADLAAHDCIVDLNFRDPHIWRLMQAGVNCRIAVNARLRLSNADAVVSAACAGLGIARLPTFMAAAALADGRLVRVLPDCEIEANGVFVVHPAGRHPPLKLRVLIDCLVAWFEDPPVWDQAVI